MKKLAVLALVILLLCGIGLWLFAPAAFNEFIKTQIETIGSETTEQTVKVNAVDFQLSKGKASISGVSISNPKNYQQPQVFTLKDISLDVDIASLAKDPIVVENFTIHNAKAFVEVTKSGKANVKDILDIIKKKLPKSTATKTETRSQKEPNIRIDKLILSGVGLTLDLRQLGYKEYQENLPTINLGNIGGEKGLPASILGKEIGEKIFASLWQQAKKVQEQKLKDKAKKKLKKEVKKLEDKAKKKLGSLLDKFKGNN